MAALEAQSDAGLVSGLPSGTTRDRSSELTEASVQGPVGVPSDLESVSSGDGAEWEDLV
jgi:hypothetical protein